MCMFRLKNGREFYCGKRYPLKCRPEICPFGQELWRILVKNDFRAKMAWLMPGHHLVTPEEAWEALRNGEAEYVVKSFSLSVGVRGRGQGRA